MDSTQADPSAYAAALQNSPNFVNPAYATPQQLAYLRATSAELMKPQTVNNWAQGLSELANSAAGVYLANKANQGQIANANAAQQELQPQQSAPGMLTTAPPAVGGAVQQSALPPFQGSAPSGQGSAVTAYGPAVASIESAGSGDYNALGPVVKSGSMAGQRAIGKYGIMEGNVGPWTQEALGQAMTPEQFRQNPKAQDATFNDRFGKYVAQTGNVKDAASMWLTGRPLADGGAAAADQNGTTGQAYADRVAQASGGPQTATGAINALPQKAPPMQMAQAQPQMQGGQPQMQGGAPQGGGPMGGMRAPQIATILADPRIDDATKDWIRGQYSPQVIGTPGGGSAAYVPGQGAQVSQAVPGVLAGGVHASSFGAPVYTTVGQGGQMQTQMALPNAQPGQGAQSGGPLAPIAPYVRQAQEMDAQGNETNRNTETIGSYKTQASDANNRLGQIASFRALGDGVESGIVSQIKAQVAKWGIPIGSDDQVGRMQAYQLMAMSLLPPGSDSFREQIPVLSATPAGRKIIADYLETQNQYLKQRGDIANGPGTSTERMEQIGKLPPPQSYHAPQAQPGPQGATGGAAQPGAGGQAIQQPQAAPGAQGGQQAAAIAAAQAAIAKGAPRAAVIKRLQDAGINPAGL